MMKQTENLKGVYRQGAMTIQKTRKTDVGHFRMTCPPPAGMCPGHPALKSRPAIRGCPAKHHVLEPQEIFGCIGIQPDIGIIHRNRNGLFFVTPKNRTQAAVSGIAADRIDQCAVYQGRVPAC
jgi:hypothetical protein